MATEILYLSAVPGLTYVQDARLGTGAEVLLCFREGKPLVETTDTPTGRRFKHNAAETRIEVAADKPFGGDTSGATDVNIEELIIEIQNV